MPGEFREVESWLNLDTLVGLVSVAVDELADELPELPPAVVPVRLEASPEPEFVAADKRPPAHSGRRKHRQRTPRSLTAKQLEAVEVFGNCESNYSQTALKLGVSINAARDRIVAAYKKLGERVPAKPQTQALPSDRRDGVAVAAGPKSEAGGDGKSRGGHDQRR
jgi:hypothetical protein